ncbi:MAG: c-type cytochrome domain-containing protein, partial [Verrucomicrobiota bacterium]
MIRVEQNGRDYVCHLNRKRFSLIMSLLFGTAILALPLNSIATTDATKERPVNFNQAISPILSKHCLECHGPDANQRKARLRLDIYDKAISPRKSKPAAILPGNSAESLLVERITSKNSDERMPPPGNGTKLSEIEIEMLKTWIDEGASYQRHWAFETVADQQLPRVRDNAWPSQSIDHFILAKLEQVELTPARRASRRTLIRRAYLD